MSDPGPPDIPEVPVAPAPRIRLSRVSLVWLVPFAALAVAGVVAWQTVAEQGPVIEVTFADAAGVQARETELRYRNVPVGVVERVRFAAGLSRVILDVRLDRSVAPYVDEAAEFWIVQPQVTTQGITGIQTVLSGVYIEGFWDEEPGEPLTRYGGRDTPPLLAAGQAGLRITLRSADGALTSEMPLLFKGVQVGQVGPPRVTADGFTVEADAAIYAPYDALITEATRFWDASGFRLSIGGTGADVDFDSISSLIVGGLAFDTFVSGARRARDGDAFIAYYDEDTARDSVFAESDVEPLNLTAEFADATGLAEGAAVELSGLRIGEVADVNTRIDPADGRVHVLAVLAIQPSRLALEEGGGQGGPEGVLRFLTDRVEGGLRARLATGSLLGGLKVQLVPVADAPPAAIDLGALPYPALPTTANDIADVAGTAQGAIERINALPIEELLESAVTFLDSAGVLVGSSETQAIPGDVRAVLSDVRALTGAPEVQAIPEQVGRTLTEAEGAVADLRAVLGDVEEADAVSRLLVAVDRAGVAAERIGAATDGVPALVDRLTAVAAEAEALDLAALAGEVQGLAADGRALLAAPGLRELPASLGATAGEARAAIAEARAIVAGLDAAALSASLEATLASAERAAANVDAAVAGVPALVGRLDALAATAAALPLEELTARLSSLAASADALVSAPGTQALPADLSAALSEAEALLREAREGGVVANANAALAAAREAADGLPGLVDRARGLLDQAQATLATFDDGSGVVRDAEAAIRDVAEAAQAIADLARAIERDPNSLIFGD